MRNAGQSFILIWTKAGLSGKASPNLQRLCCEAWEPFGVYTVDSISWNSLRDALNASGSIEILTDTGLHVQVLVRDNNVDQALRALKKKMQREGIFREMKMRGHYEKPSEKRAREKAEAVRRSRKLARKRAQREGLIGGGRTAAR